MQEEIVGRVGMERTFILLVECGTIKRVVDGFSLLLTKLFARVEKCVKQD